MFRLATLYESPTLLATVPGLSGVENGEEMGLREGNGKNGGG